MNKTLKKIMKEKADKTELQEQEQEQHNGIVIKLPGEDKMGKGVQAARQDWLGRQQGENRRGQEVQEGLHPRGEDPEGD